MISRTTSLTVQLLLLTLGVTVPGVARPALAEVPSGFSRVVLMARESLDIKEEVVVTSGDVVVNGDATDSTAAPSTDAVGGFESSPVLDIDKDVATAPGYELVADSIRIKVGTVIGGDVRYNVLDNSGTINGALHSPLALPFYAFLPPFETGVPGTDDVNVEQDQTVSLPAGAYRDLNVDQGGTVLLEGGAYAFQSVELGQFARLLADDRAQVTVASSIDAGSETTIGPSDGSGIDASEIVIYVAGGGSSAVTVDKESRLRANIYAPEGEVHLKTATSATGAIVARTIQIEKGVRITLNSFFNEPPEAMDDSFDVLEGGAVTGNLLANDTDPNDDDLSLTIPPPGSPAHAVSLVLDVDGTFTYTHDGSETLSDGFQYEVCDNGTPVECDTALAAFNILPVNDAPTLDQPADETILEDVEIHQTALTGISAGGGEVQALAVSVSSGNPGVLPDPQVSYDSPAGTGLLIYSPLPDQYGDVVVTVTVMDDGGTANGGIDTIQRTFTVHVEPVNDPPLVGDDSAETDVDVSVTVGVLANDADIDGNLLPATLKIVGAPSIGGASVDPLTGTVTYTPDQGASGGDSFEYEVCDDGTPLPSRCGIGIVSVTVVAGGGGNQPPSADPRDAFTEGAASIEIFLTALDPDDDTLTFGITSPPSQGTLSAITPIVPNGQCSETVIVCTDDSQCPGTETCVLPPVTSAMVTYAPTSPAALEVDSFLFGVTDPSGASDTAEIRINPDGDPTEPPPGPEAVAANPLSSETLVDTPSNLTLSGLAPCDGECDGLGDVDLTFFIESGPSSGSLGALVQGPGAPRRTATITYTPNTGFTGTDNFDFRVEGDVNFDGDTTDPGETDTATVSVAVETPSQPTAPTATDVNATVEMGTEIPIPLSGTPGDPGGTGESGSSSIAGSGTPSISVQVGTNGSRGGAESTVEAGPTAIVPGAGWSATSQVPPAFFWSGTPPVTSPDGPFTFTGDGCVSVTDDFNPGDQFNVYDNGQLIGTTPLVQPGPDVEVGPDAAYADPTYSSGTFVLPEAGSHSIDIEVIPPNSLSGGRGYLRVDPPGSGLCDSGGGCGLTFTIEAYPEFGTVGLVAPLTSTTAEVLYAPASGFTGTDTFSYRVTDCYGGTALGLVEVLVINTASCQSCFTIDVSLGGQGGGDVTSQPLAISCGGTCSGDFNLGSPVVLQARPTGLSQFSGWSGECTGGNPIVIVDETDDADNDGVVECFASFD